MADRLYKSRDDRMLAGVAGGVAESLDADPSIIRIVWVLLVFLTGGIALVVYLVMAVVVPEAPEASEASAPGGPVGAIAAGSAGAQSSSVSPTPVGPGGWLAPDGSTVPMAGAGGAGSSAQPGSTGRAGRRDPADRARGAFIVGLVLILIGLFFLVREFAPAIDLGLWWPVVAIVLGVLLVVMSVLPPRRPS